MAGNTKWGESVGDLSLCCKGQAGVKERSEAMGKSPRKQQYTHSGLYAAKEEGSKMMEAKMKEAKAKAKEANDMIRFSTVSNKSTVIEATKPEIKITSAIGNAKSKKYFF